MDKNLSDVMIDKLVKQKDRFKKVISSSELKKLRSLNLIDEIKFRNYKILSDYINFRKKMNYLDALEKLSEKYFLSTETIHDILYKRIK